jgi:hypothetical protein
MKDDGNVGDNADTSKSLTVTVVATAPSTPRPTTAATKKSTAKPSASPTATPEPSEWDTALQSATSLTNGGTLTVDVAKTAQMPVALLTSLKDKQGKLTVNLGGYTCAIDGAKLAGVPAEGAIDLSMSMEKDAALSQKAGGADLYQMKFAHTGPLPGPFAYTFKAAQNKPGDTLYLYYYYDEPGVLDATRCLSYWTQAPTSIPEAYREELGATVYGCDVCQDVCPWNRAVVKRRSGVTARAEATPTVSLREWLERDGAELVADLDRLYVPRNEPRWLQRNALVVAGNVGTQELVPAVEHYVVGDDELLRETAQWALSRIEERMT